MSSESKRWLLTGGAGYIGSHVLYQMRDAGHDVVVVDDLSAGLRERLPEDVTLIEANVQQRDVLEATMRDYDIVGVIHFAARKAVGESVEKPLYYYRENVDGVLSILEAMAATGVRRIVYSSSAAVYGEPGSGLVSEDTPLVPTSPYGETKVLGEWAVKSNAVAGALRDLPLSYVLLRYFNVAGAGSPKLGDNSVANLIPLVLRAATNGERPQVFGSDYDTPDGTCVRDYIHVSDLAGAHVGAVNACVAGALGEVQATYNVGTGTGSSVREVIDMASEVLGRDLDPEYVARRAGDPAFLVASPDRIQEGLGWSAKHDLRSMVTSAWEAWPKS